MKKINLLLAIIVVMVGFFSSCEDEDKNTYAPHDEIGKGAFFRSIGTAGTINKNDIANSFYSITGELVSENPSDVSSIDLKVEFQDFTTDGDPDTDDDESLDAVLVKTVSVSDMTANSNNLPQTTFEVTANEALQALSLDSSVLDGDDVLLFSLAINMANGTVFDAKNTGDSVRGELFFGSPLTYAASVVCLSAPVAGDWALAMQDQFGDGWNGGKITVDIDGAVTEYAAEGSGSSVTISIPEGTTKFTFTYTSGNWEVENTYTLTDPNGTVVLDEGPTPTTGELLNKCE